MRRKNSPYRPRRDKENPGSASYQTSITFTPSLCLAPLLLSADMEGVRNERLQLQEFVVSVCCALCLRSFLSHFKQLLPLLPHTFLCPLLFCIIYSRVIRLHFVNDYSPCLCHPGSVPVMCI